MNGELMTPVSTLILPLVMLVPSTSLSVKSGAPHKAAV
jgi:hypothetical protein